MHRCIVLQQSVGRILSVTQAGFQAAHGAGSACSCMASTDKPRWRRKTEIAKQVAVGDRARACDAHAAGVSPLGRTLERASVVLDLPEDEATTAGSARPYPMAESRSRRLSENTDCPQKRSYGVRLKQRRCCEMQHFALHGIAWSSARPSDCSDGHESRQEAPSWCTRKLSSAFKTSPSIHHLDARSLRRHIQPWRRRIFALS